MRAKGNKYPRKLSSYNFTLMNAANGLLAAYESNFMVILLRVDFSPGQKLGQPNGVYIATKSKDMLEGMDRSALGMVFLFMAFIDQAAGY